MHATLLPAFPFAGSASLAAASAGGAGDGAGAAGVGGWVDASLGKTLLGPDGEERSMGNGRGP